MHEQPLSKFVEGEGSDFSGFKEIFLAMVQHEAKKRPSIE
jgi:hypothetical protein